jgi:chemotaxis protein CheD
VSVQSAESLAVGLGELKTSGTGQLIAYSLGSCVAICLHDPLKKVGAMAHVVLPAAPGGDPKGVPGKYADTAVPALLAAIEQQGGSRFRLRCVLAGGGAVLALGGGGALPNIGQRNVEAVRSALTQARLKIAAEATGGNQGRTVRMDAASGRVMTRTVHGAEVAL